MATWRPKASGYAAPGPTSSTSLAARASGYAAPGVQPRPRPLRPGGLGRAGSAPLDNAPQLTARLLQSRERTGGHPLPAVVVGSSSANEVVRFLTQHGLHMYSQVLLKEGFDEMETLQAIDEKDMTELGIMPLHVARLKRSLPGFKARIDNEVVVFLRQPELEQYGPKLMQQGFDEMATLVEITEDDLRDMGLVRGHSLKLKRHLREYAAEHSLALQVEGAEAVTFQLSRGCPPTPGSRRTSERGSERGSRSVTPEREAVDEFTEFSIGAKAPTNQAMDGDMRTHVQKSWEKVQEIGTLAVAELLMKRTMELDPEAIHLYVCKAQPTEDETVTDVARKLFARTLYILGSSAAGLSDTATVVKNLSAQGRKLANSGVKESYFDTVGIAFQMTLKEVLGDRFTAEVAAAWKVAYDFMTAVMVSGMRSAEHTEEGEEAPSSLI